MALAGGAATIGMHEELRRPGFVGATVDGTVYYLSPSA